MQADSDFRHVLGLQEASVIAMDQAVRQALQFCGQRVGLTTVSEDNSGEIETLREHDRLAKSLRG
jgi:hypothetical protein